MLMDPRAMAPYGRALQAYASGNRDARLMLCRDDGRDTPIPAALFFRGPEHFNALDRAAVEQARGRVLDVGAGTGVHALALVARGLEVTAIDVCPAAVEIMKDRGLADVRVADILEFEDPAGFETVLILGHGIGMVETLDGLDRVLARLRDLVVPGGQVLFDTLDVRVGDDPANHAYHEANRRAGRYIGEIRMRFEFDGVAGPLCGWLHLDPEMLAARAAARGWACSVVRAEPSGDYLARLTPSAGADPSR